MIMFNIIGKNKLIILRCIPHNIVQYRYNPKYHPFWTFNTFKLKHKLLYNFYLFYCINLSMHLWYDWQELNIKHECHMNK